ncbi:Os03g0319400 [Oryza sativa Japonica Group]|jgi:serine/threonine protein kinase|uniref:Os03g0319400 protein n=1 Tax=Oryza sativa subsp. japonica TaxID=39947 RepID=A0A0P0VWU4_ORYSJ|nr:Os03g0319400 [Oryza sativa Japonica Group]
MYRAKRAALSPKVKRRVGKYELGRTIGEGTFAKVRFAKNTENDEPVAIKILDKEKVQKHRLVEQVILRHLFFGAILNQFPYKALHQFFYQSLCSSNIFNSYIRLTSVIQSTRNILF